MLAHLKSHFLFGNLKSISRIQNSEFTKSISDFRIKIAILDERAWNLDMRSIKNSLLISHLPALV